MPFSDPIVAGTDLVRDAIQSPNFATDPVSGNVTGWQIARDGTATFTDLAVGNSLWGVDDQGNATFNNLNVTDTDMTLGGVKLLDRAQPYIPTAGGLLWNMPWGCVAWGVIATGASITGDGEIGLGEVALTAIEGRLYKLNVAPLMVNTTGTVGTVGFRIRNGGSSKPTITSNLIHYVYQRMGNTGFYTLQAAQTFRCYTGASNSGLNGSFGIEPGVNRILVDLYTTAGTTASVYVSGNINVMQIWWEDIGPYLGDTGYSNDGSGGTGGGTSTYTTTFNATWSGSYLGDSSRRNTNSSCYQGYYSGYPANGNQKSMIGFDYAAIQSALSGATINSCQLYLYYSHWYNNSGGTAVIGTHNQAVSSAPSTWSGTSNRVTSSGWPKPGGRWVELGTTIGNELKAGTSKGIVLGPGPTTSNTYYGYANGYSQSNAPKLQITYVK